MSYSDKIQSLWTEVKEYLELQKQYLLMDTAEKLTVLLSAVATAVVCMTIGAMALFFLLFAFATWIGQIAGNAFLGYLVMGILLLILMAIVYIGHNRWIIQPLSRLVVGIFLGSPDTPTVLQEKKTATRGKIRDSQQRIQKETSQLWSPLSKTTSRTQSISRFISSGFIAYNSIRFLARILSTLRTIFGFRRHKHR